MTSRAFWRAALERAAKTFAQVLIVMLVGDAVTNATGFDVLAADWPGALSYAAGGALLSILTSVASAKVTGGDPSLATEHVARHAE